MRDHWCVAYRDAVSLRVATSRYLSRGLALGEQVGVFGWGETDRLRSLLSGLAGADALVGQGAARVASLGDRFEPDRAPDPQQLVGYWAEATEAALDAGFRGLRAVADTTPWARLDHDQRLVFLRGEQLVNHYRLDHPHTLICVCDASQLPPDALLETAAVHPQTDGVSSRFTLYATGPSSLTVRGEIDHSIEPALRRVLDCVPPAEADDELVIDAAELRFIDHRSLIALAEYAEQTDRPAVVLRRASSTTATVVHLLNLPRLRVRSTR